MDRLADSSSKIKSIEVTVMQEKLSEIMNQLEDNLEAEERIDLVPQERVLAA